MKAREVNGRKQVGNERREEAEEVCKGEKYSVGNQDINIGNKNKVESGKERGKGETGKTRKGKIKERSSK